jgi:AP2 domain/HNH endonuclease
MQQIPLSQGQVAIVDDADYPLLADFRWSYRSERGGKQGYADRHFKVEGKDRLC